MSSTTPLRGPPRLADPVAFVTGAGTVALITALIDVLAERTNAPTASLGVLYIFAVLPTSVLFGMFWAVLVAIASALVFDWFYVPPERSLPLEDESKWVVSSATAAYLATAVVVGDLAARARRRARVSEEARDVLAGEQASLRRVATLVARGEPPSTVFASVAEEVGRLLDADATGMLRREADDTGTLVAGWVAAGDPLPIGERRPLADPVLRSVLETGRAERSQEPGAAAAFGPEVRRLGIRSSVSAPIVVGGRVWGAIVAGSKQESFPEGTEARMLAFTELVGTAIANAQARSELTASRRRLVAMSDETRRRIERDLHDGIQQRLVSLALDLRAAELTVPHGNPGLKEEIGQVVDGLNRAREELREISRGIHPATLSDSGLAPAVRALAVRSAVPVALEIRTEERLPARVEVAAYYVLSEALTNVAKHARATSASVLVELSGAELRLVVSDDGVGGADPSRGSGLIGLTDRIEALGGRLTVSSPPGEGTTLETALPVEPESDAD